MDSCSNCGSLFDPSDEKCSTCGDTLGFPNVRAANQSVEIEALKSRYEAAVQRAASRNAAPALEDFEAAVSHSTVVVNCDLYRLREMAAEGKSLYSNYHLAVRAEVRKAADQANDRVRRAIDSMFFGTYADQIRFGALTIDGRGLTSYGAYSLVLRDIAIAKRASLLEENSYSFVERHKLNASDCIPAGFRSAWGNRQKLAVVKLADGIQAETTKSEYPGILLRNGSAKSDDDFMEVHIYGPFNIQSVESVCGDSSPKRPEERTLLVVVKELLAKSGKSWIES